MNMYLHGIGETESPIIEQDALAVAPQDRWDMVLTNPPFGRQGSFAISDEEGKITRERDSYERDDFVASTSNNQLNFLQHIMTILRPDGVIAHPAQQPEGPRSWPALTPISVAAEGG